MSEDATRAHAAWFHSTLQTLSRDQMPSVVPIGRDPLLRTSSTLQRGRGVTPVGASGRTTQRVAAAESDFNSDKGRASSATHPEDSDASCKRRVAAMSNPLPSATTAQTAADRSAVSIAQRRDAVSGVST